MNKEDYVTFTATLFDEMHNLITKKNHDYSFGDDPFSNFRIAESVGVDPLTGLFIRMEDKNQRIRTFLKTGELAVADESIADAFKDLIGYSCLALGMIEERRQRQPVSERP